MDERECACTYVWGRTHVSSAKSSQSVKPNVCMHCNLWHMIKTFNAATVLFCEGKSVMESVEGKELIGHC